MYRLYWDAGTGALAPEVMLEETGLAYERVPVDLEAGEHREPEYLRINPAGLVPALELPDGRVMTESAAMVLYLGEQHPEGGLVPEPQHADRPEFLRWLLFMATPVYMALTRVHYPERYTTEPAAADSVRQAALGELDGLFPLLDNAIAGDPWFLPHGYSALDVYLAMVADWHPDPTGLLERNPSLGRLCAATEQREIFARVMARHRA